eukprot:TRINITY_DN783_c0_g1_i1.p1 TRINITY_DN783_c0_g1~~TRINITY_DN783_c0_g1_i1.p1  ORF type:complete len:176 (-),score=40.29 TRINITY_DN783_c0_g1_i1:93-620(-)
MNYFSSFFASPLGADQQKNLATNVRRYHYKVDDEEVTIRIEYADPVSLKESADVPHIRIDMFSLDNGVYHLLYQHMNRDVLLSHFHKNEVEVGYSSDKSEVTLHLGPHGVLPIVLARYPVQTSELKILVLEEEVRRIKSLITIPPSHNASPSPARRRASLAGSRGVSEPQPFPSS